MKNVAASNRAKLLNLSRKTGQSFQELVQYFAMSRFLYRLAVSEVSQDFILKGAMLLHARNVAKARSTLDIDLLGYMDNSPEALRKAVEQIIGQDVDDDGIVFLPETIEVSEITRDAGYVGRRVNFRAMLGKIKIPMQIDVGVGDNVIPEPILIDTPSLLDYPSAKLRGYAFETSIAEKAHVMLKLELLNSRMKDFYDIWLLSNQAKVDEKLLVDALVGTFTMRDTSISLDSIIFTEAFISDPDKQMQWKAFCGKRAIKDAPEQFADVAGEVLAFLKPSLEKARKTMEGPGKS